MPGIAFTGLGMLFVAPLLYEARQLSDGAHAISRLLVLALGVAFLVTGLPALGRGVGNSALAPAFLRRLERVLFALAHLIVCLTLAGMILLVLLGMRSAVSGVPIGMGMLIAGFMYVCAGICTAVR